MEGWRDAAIDEMLSGQSKAISRRAFLKMAGIAGAAASLGVGLGSLAGACGSDGTTTGQSSSAADLATSAIGTATTAGAEAGRPIKVGVVASMTGPMAIFGAADEWSIGLMKKAVGDGILLGDRKVHPIEAVLSDTQSDSNRASQVAGDLILNDKVDILLASGTPDTTDPAADQAEANGVPFLCTQMPWQPFLSGRQATMDTTWKWTYGHLFGLEQDTACQIAAFDKVATNKKVGLLLPNDADGAAWAEPVSDALSAAGYEVTLPGLYQVGSEDFTQQISAFKKAGCEVLSGTNAPGDYSNFWKQSLQQGFNPRVAYSGRALGTWEMVKALGDNAVGMMIDVAWHPSWPYTDGLSGMTSEELAADWTRTTGSHWSFLIGAHEKMPWAIDVLQRATNPEDKNTIVEAIKTSKLSTITGPIDFTAPVDPAGLHVTANVYKPSWALAQLVKTTDGTIDWVTVSVVDGPPELVAQQDPVPMVYS